MTTLTKGSPLYDEVLGTADLSTPFESRYPTYADFKNGFLYPDTVALLIGSQDVLHANQATDVRSGMQRICRDLVVDLGGQAPINLPSSMLDGVRSIVNSLEIDLAITAEVVTNVVFPMDGSSFASQQGAKNVAIGVGLATLGVEVPVVGTIAAAIIGLALGVRKLVTNWKVKQNAADAEARAKFYAALPPLQTGGSETDNALIESVLRPALRTRDLTQIFMPRFEGTQWAGLPRDGGYAFAQGKAQAGGSDVFLQDIEVFTPNEGALGVIPGTSRVTAVIQVSFQTDTSQAGSEAWTSFQKGGQDPRNAEGAWQRVTDTGLYYPATGRLAGNLWNLCRQKGNPLKYRLDPVRMHAAWREWAESGLAYIRDTCYGWYAKFRRGSDKFDPDLNLDGWFGTAVFHGIGAWASQVVGGTTYKPTYQDFPRPFGYTGDQMAASWAPCYGFQKSAIWSGRSGSWLPISNETDWHDSGMGENYNRGLNIRGTLTSLQKQMSSELGTTLVAAYCSVNDAAFVGDLALKERMLKMRSLLLTHKDRMLIDLADVREDEPGIPGQPNWESWRKQLLAVGVPVALPPKAKGDLQIDPSDLPPWKPNYCEAGVVCEVPETDDPEPGFTPMPANPWEPPQTPPKRHGRVSSGGSGSGAGAIAAIGGSALVFGLGAALLGAARRRKMKSRNFSAGRLRR